MIYQIFSQFLHVFSVNSGVIFNKILAEVFSVMHAGDVRKIFGEIKN